MAINKTEAKLLRILINKGEVYADKDCPKESRAAESIIVALGYAVTVKPSMGGQYLVIEVANDI